MFEIGKSRQLGHLLPHDEAVTLVETYAGFGEGAGWKIPEGHSAQTYVTHLIHCGALQEDSENDSMICPIPSFQSYILRRGGLDPAVRAAPALNREGPPSRKNEGDDGTRFGMGGRSIP